MRRSGNRLARAARGAAPLVCALWLAACGGQPASSSPAAAATAPAVAAAPVSQPAAAAAQAAGPAGPSAESTGGFDGGRAYQYVADLVAIGPRTAGTEGGRRAQQYIVGKLQSFGCAVDQQDFKSATPIGSVAMKNIIAKIPGTSSNIVMFATHYDTKRELDPELPHFVGADDGGSSTGIMLELASLLCKKKSGVAIWIAFLDGEEAFNFNWKDPDNTYGSRELAARMALAGELPRMKAFILADMVGSRDLRIKRESDSTPWLTDLVWDTAKRLGYQDIFLPDRTTVEDDHQSFLRRKVAAVDMIDMEIPYWHTPQDTLDKISPRSLAVVGHVLVAILPALEKRFGAH